MHKLQRFLVSIWTKETKITLIFLAIGSILFGIALMESGKIQILLLGLSFALIGKALIQPSNKISAAGCCFGQLIAVCALLLVGESVGCLVLLLK